MRKKLGKSVLIAALALAMLAGLKFATARPRPDKPYLVSDRPLVMAHRGASGLAPENTLVAFRKALEAGADVLELDVHATEDGQVVVIHDETVDRTTDGTGLVKDFTLEELKRLDAGYRFTPDGGATYPYRGQGIAIPTLEEVLAAFPQARINVEIKQLDPPIEDRLWALIEGMGAEDRVLVISFDDEAIARFRKLAPGVATGAAEGEIREFVTYLTLRMAPFYAPKADAFQVPEWYGEHHIVTRAFVDAAHSKNVKVHVWTVNEKEDMRRLLELGVDGIITDYPDRLVEVMKEMEW